MNEYIIYCTEEQTKKALKLGAPIEILPNYTEYRMFPFVKCTDGNERPCVLPTAEQMIGWLEGTYIGSIEPVKFADGSEEWGYRICDKDMRGILWHIGKVKHLYSRKEATLAAIDVALEYLTNKK